MLLLSWRLLLLLEWLRYLLSRLLWCNSKFLSLKYLLNCILLRLLLLRRWNWKVWHTSFNTFKSLRHHWSDVRCCYSKLYLLIWAQFVEIWCVWGISKEQLLLWVNGGYLLSIVRLISRNGKEDWVPEAKWRVCDKASQGLIRNAASCLIVTALWRIWSAAPTWILDIVCIFAALAFHFFRWRRILAVTSGIISSVTFAKFWIGSKPQGRCRWHGLISDSSNKLAYQLMLHWVIEWIIKLAFPLLTRAFPCHFSVFV